MEVFVTIEKAKDGSYWCQTETEILGGYLTSTGKTIEEAKDNLNECLAEAKEDLERRQSVSANKICLQGRIMKRKILISLIGIVVLIPLGLYSRHISWLPKETGDALWAMMVFCFWRIILVKSKLRTVAIVSLTHSFIVEFSQLLRWPWLVSFRDTFVGHMMLGQGFLWTDLVAYVIGIIIIYWVFKALEIKQ